MEASIEQARNAAVVNTILASLPQFSGTNNSISWSDMTNCIKDVAAMLEITLDKVAICVPFKLRRQARDTYFEWIYQKRNELDNNEEEQYRLTFRDLNALMASRFEGAHMVSVKIEEYLDMCQQANESAFEFETRLNKVLRATGLDLPEPFKLAFLKMKLRANGRSRLQH